MLIMAQAQHPEFGTVTGSANPQPIVARADNDRRLCQKNREALLDGLLAHAQGIARIAPGQRGISGRGDGMVQTLP